MMRGPWDLRFFLLQQALVLVGALGLVLMSCGPLRESPYKSSLFGSRLGSATRGSSCVAFFVPQHFFPKLASILPEEAMSAFRSGGSATFETSSLPTQFSQCAVELDASAALIHCTPEDLHSETFRIVTSTVGRQTTVQLEHEGASGAASAHCALRSIRGIGAVIEPSETFAAEARAASLSAWPSEP